MLYTYLMEVIHSGHNICNKTDVCESLLASETNIEGFYKNLDINGDVIDYNLKIKDDPIKIVQTATDKIMNLIIKECDTIKTNLSNMGHSELHYLNPLQYPLFTSISSSQSSSILSSILFICGTISIAYMIRKNTHKMENTRNSINTDSINTDSINTDSINTDSINTDSINTDSDKETIMSSEETDTEIITDLSGNSVIEKSNVANKDLSPTVRTGWLLRKWF